jgi:uncharacterized membrane protein
MPMSESAAPPQPRAARAGRGVDWIAEGFELFRREPGTWIGVLLIWFLLTGAIAGVGLGIVSSFLNPVFTAGMMLGCASLARGEGLRVEHLFAAFKSGRLGSLLMLTVWVFVIGFGAVLVATVLVGWPLVGVWQSVDNPTPQEVVAAVGVIRLLLIALAALVLAVLFAMATWFAPALIVFRGLTALDALKLSFRGCMKSWLALTVYGLVAIALVIVASIPLLLGLLIAIPVLTASVYAAYRDIFDDVAGGPRESLLA